MRLGIAAAFVWVGSVAVIGSVGAVTALTGCDDAVRGTLDFSFPKRDNWADMGIVLWRNGLLAAAALTFARTRVHHGATAYALTAGWAANVCLAGAALGAYGERLVRHAGVYGALELAGFSVVLAISLRLRREGGHVRGGELLAASTLLLMAAFAETIGAWRL